MGETFRFFGPPLKTYFQFIRLYTQHTYYSLTNQKQFHYDLLPISRAMAAQIWQQMLIFFQFFGAMPYDEFSIDNKFWIENLLQSLRRVPIHFEDV